MRTHRAVLAIALLTLLGMGVAAVQSASSASAGSPHRKSTRRQAASSREARTSRESGPRAPVQRDTEDGNGDLPRQAGAAASASRLDSEAFGIRGALQRDEGLERNLGMLAIDPRLRVGAFVFDLGSGRFGSLRGEDPFAAASTIKLPVAVELLRRVDLGEISLEEKLVLREEDKGDGSGGLQYFTAGTLISVKRTAELMIRRSDNTATNMIIARLGGIGSVNASIEALRLPGTLLRNLLPDMAGTNQTTPRDLASILARVTRGSLLAPTSRDLLFSWMRRSHVKSLLPAGLGRGAVCYNKTGDIPGALADAGVIQLPDGRRYVAVVQVERPRNSRRANEMIRRLSRAAYEHLL